MKTSRVYFGWTIVAAATVLTLLTVGMRMGIGPFFLPMTTSLGLTRSELSEIVALGMLCYALAGHLVHAWGTRAVLMSLGLSFTSPVALSPVISRWFVRQRDMALFSCLPARWPASRC